jgi:D-alanine-D-alanine ligase
MLVVILHSAIADNAGPDEQDTLIQVAAVHAALETLGHDVTSLPFTLDFAELIKNLQRYKPALVFNLVESLNGRGQNIYLAPLLLQQLGIPYTGAQLNAFLLTANKCTAKRWMMAGSIATPEIATEVDRSLAPYIIKSATEDGSLGITQDSIVYDEATLQAVIAARQQQFSGEWFAERYIAGREFNIALLAGPNGPQVLPIAEMQFIDFPEGQLPIVDYAAKWHTHSREYQATVRNFIFNDTDQILLNKLTELSLACWHWFKASGYARVDVRVDANGQPWVLELNVNPGIAPDAGFIAAAQQQGLDYITVIKRIIEDVLC